MLVFSLIQADEFLQVTQDYGYVILLLETHAIN